LFEKDWLYLRRVGKSIEKNLIVGIENKVFEL